MPVNESVGVIRTGKSEIDKRVGGGVPLGSLILVEGQSDSGKSVFTQQLTWGSLRDGYRVSMLSSENSMRSMLRHMNSLNLDVLDHLLLGRLKVFRVRTMAARGGSKHAMGSLIEAVDRQVGQDLVIVDSLTSFVAHSSPAETLSFFEDCKSHTDKGMTIALVAHSYAFNQGMLVRISSMCDAHFRFSIEPMGDKLVKTLEVSKVRGANMKTGNVISFDIEPAIGMRIIPFSKARA